MLVVFFEELVDLVAVFDEVDFFAVAFELAFDFLVEALEVVFFEEVFDLVVLADLVDFLVVLLEVVFLVLAFFEVLFLAV